jgi:hypothetical protein
MLNKVYENKKWKNLHTGAPVPVGEAAAAPARRAQRVSRHAPVLLRRELAVEPTSPSPASPTHAAQLRVTTPTPAAAYPAGDECLCAMY